MRAIPVLMDQNRASAFCLTRFLHTNRYRPAIQVRDKLSSENALVSRTRWTLEKLMIPVRFLVQRFFWSSRGKREENF